MNIMDILYLEVLPWVLRFVMVGLGLTLSLADLKRVVVFPKAVIVGLTGQLILLPLLAFAMALLLAPTPEIAVGVIILAACPGGVTSNAYAFAARADVALSVTLTAISSFITVLTIPTLTYIALQVFMQQGQVPELPVLQMFQTLATFTVIPIAIGMTLRAIWPTAVQRAIDALRRVTVAVLMFVIVAAAVSSYELILTYFLQASLLVVGLNISSMLMGFGLARAAQLNTSQSITITYEIGVQNLTLALLITLTLLRNESLAITTLLYAAVMPATAMTFIAIARGMLNDEVAVRELEGC
jgi:BASS family bile acid:Na+ symporter